MMIFIGTQFCNLLEDDMRLHLQPSVKQMKTWRAGPLQKGIHLSLCQAIRRRKRMRKLGPRSCLFLCSKGWLQMKRRRVQAEGRAQLKRVESSRRLQNSVPIKIIISQLDADLIDHRAAGKAPAPRRTSTHANRGRGVLFRSRLPGLRRCL